MVNLLFRQDIARGGQLKAGWKSTKLQIVIRRHAHGRKGA